MPFLTRVRNALLYVWDLILDIPLALRRIPAAIRRIPAGLRAIPAALRRIPEGIGALVERARDLPPWTGLIAGVLGAAIIAVVVIDPFGGDDSSVTTSGSPSSASSSQQASASQSLGFPAFATKDTTRVAGSDAPEIAAGTSLAVFPGVEQRPEAVTLFPQGNWQAGIAGSALMAPPVRAPLLVSGPGGVPSSTNAALKVLQPVGGDQTQGKQAFAIAGASVPGGLRSYEVPGGSDAAAMADAVDQLRAKLAETPEPKHMVIVSEDEPAYAMPAAAWAARSGDPVFFTKKDSVPPQTAAALKRHKGIPAYVLGPETAVSTATFKALKKDATTLTRVSGEDPVANAIAFARFQDATFGWNINDPGHGLVLANLADPMYAGASSALSGSGKYGPLLLTDDPDRVPDALRSYLLDIKPGYQDDPTRAFYNHMWIVGDVSKISIAEQGQLDALLELAPVGQATAPTESGSAPAAPTAPGATTPSK